MTFLLVMAMAVSQTGQVPAGFKCLMRPPQIDVHNIKYSAVVKSFVVDEDKRTASVLLKDGSVLRVTNGGCEHAYSTVRLLVVGPKPLASDVEAWVKMAKQASDIGFDPVESRLFDRWLGTAKFTRHGNNGLSAEGVTAGAVQYEVDVTNFDSDIGAVVTVSYTYDG